MPPPLAPTSPADRIAAMDVLRGLALLGIFAVNLPAMALPSDVAFAPAVAAPWYDTAAWVVVRGAFQTKAFALFSALFGMGLVLQARRAERAGRPFTRLYLRRLGVLAAMGLAHGFLLFAGDILFVYSVAGLALLLGRRLRPRACVAIAAVALAIGAALSVAFDRVEEAAPRGEPPARSAPAELRLEDLLAAETSADWAALETRAYADGPLAATLLVNGASFAAWLAISSVISFNWKVLAFLFLGAALMKHGFFEPRRADLQRRLVLVGLPVGLALEGFAVAAALRTGSDGSSVAAVLATEVGSTCLAAAYLGGLTRLVAVGRAPRLRGAMAAAGRLALTHYLLQSVVGNLVFRWYGLDLFGQLGRAAVLGLAVGVFALQVAASRPWLARFRAGPLEGLWRRLTYGRG